ncbi:MAG: molybdenum cofactor guanylyltransferase [Elusimicrobia bacterium]|nr:molybdenum cofactor guanylyltransferase [Elusimicrobiota bacterium]
MTNRATGIILAGGNSSRFGSNKALAPWDGGQKLVERVCGILRPLFSKKLILTKNIDDFGFMGSSDVRVLQDLFPEHHSLGGICSGLHHAQTEFAFVCAVDMPLLQPKLIEALWLASAGYEAAVPVWHGVVQPLCGFYSKNCLGILRHMVAENRLRIHELFGIIRTRFFQEKEILALDPEGISFLDIDTREDYEKARSLR